MLLKTTGVSILTILLATQFGPLQQILDTVELTVGEWALCVVVAASIVVICEVKKLLHIRTGEEPEAELAAASTARAQRARLERKEQQGPRHGHR